MYFLASLLVVFSSIAYSSEQNYKCDFIWKTLSENAAVKNRLVQKSSTAIINQDMVTIINIGDKSSGLQTREYYKDNKKNFIEHNFSCDRYLNCSGSRIKMTEGKKESEKIEIVSNAASGFGKIGSRELFQYRNTNKDFTYHYIIYRNEKGEPMGLKVSCNK